MHLSIEISGLRRRRREKKTRERGRERERHEFFVRPTQHIYGWFIFQFIFTFRCEAVYNARIESHCNTHTLIYDCI